MKIAILTTDNREPFREYHKPDPWFGTAPEALLHATANDLIAGKNCVKHIFSQPARPENRLDAHTLSRLRSCDKKKTA
jgi:hypothetical protein